MAEKVQVTIDREECIVCGTCWSDCSEFFEESPEDGFSQVIESYRVNNNPAEGEAPLDLKDCVTEAADGCPVEIIHVH